MCLILYVWCTYALCGIPNLQIKCKFSIVFKFFMFFRPYVVVVLLHWRFFCFCSYFEKNNVIKLFYFWGSSIVIEVLFVLWFFSYFKALFLLWFYNIHCTLVNCIVYFCGFITFLCSVATLALGSRPRQGFARVRAKKGARECGRVWEWTLTLPNELPFWELESRWTPGTSKSDWKGQNPSPWGVLYIIRNLLKCKCPKWARMTHLDICNTSYGQKKGQKSNWQFDSRPQKVRNRPDSLACRWRATCRWKALDKGYNFDSDLVPIGGLHWKL